MKQSILAKLIVKYPGLSKVFLGQLAEKLSATVTAEDQIEGKLTELDSLPISIQDLAAEFQKEGDRRVSDAKKEWEKKNPKPAPPKTEGDPDPAANELPDETPEWVKKSLIPKLEGLEQKIAKLETEKVQNTILQQIKGHEKVKDVPEDFWSEWKMPEKPEEVEAFAERVATKYAPFAQAQTEKGLLSVPPPKNGQQTPPGAVKEASKEELAAIEL